jgi:predicted MPP superfamily phosphohydrolase
MDVKPMNKSWKKRNVSFITLIIISTLIYGYLQNNWIEVERLDVKIADLPKELVGLSIAHISDVHIPRNASTLENIVATVKSENPDLIVITGDIVDKRSNPDDTLLSDFCKGLSAITSTYAVSGNHEVWSGDLAKWEQTLQQNGVNVIENKVEIISKGNGALAILGLKDEQIYSDSIFNDLEGVQHIPKLLLAHRPELFSTYYAESNSIKPDLVFSGHAHGGQFRIPFLNQGLAAPNQGLFPKLTSGLYKAANGVQMVISRGLGNSIFPLRINNRPHLPIVYLK